MFLWKITRGMFRGRERLKGATGAFSASGGKCEFRAQRKPCPELSEQYYRYSIIVKGLTE